MSKGSSQQEASSCWRSARSPGWARLRLSPSTAETEWLRGILAFWDGETSSWLNRFLLTFVTSGEKQDQPWSCETTLAPRLSS